MSFINFANQRKAQEESLELIDSWREHFEQEGDILLKNIDTNVETFCRKFRRVFERLIPQSVDTPEAREVMERLRDTVVDLHRRAISICHKIDGLQNLIRE